VIAAVKQVSNFPVAPHSNEPSPVVSYGLNKGISKSGMFIFDDYRLAGGNRPDCHHSAKIAGLYCRGAYCQAVGIASLKRLVKTEQYTVVITAYGHRQRHCYIISC
jgi:hypothetical protein